MAEFIAESPRLLRLDLRENEIKTGGLMALSLALKVNTSLLRLDLDREPKKETVSTGEGAPRSPRAGKTCPWEFFFFVSLVALNGDIFCILTLQENVSD